MEERVITEEKMNNILFDFFCLNDKLGMVAEQVINKKVEGHNINAGLIKIGISKSINENQEEFTFEINKKKLGKLIERLEELYEKL